MFKHKKRTAFALLLTSCVLLSNALFGAASSSDIATVEFPSMQQILKCEQGRRLYLPVGLQTGFGYLSGVGNKQKRNYKMAEQCFISVIGVRLLRTKYLCKAKLYLAAMYLSGGYGLEADSLEAGLLIQEVLKNPGAFPEDKFYAYLILSDLAHMYNQQDKTAAKALAEYSAKLESVADELDARYDSLKVEFFARMAKQ